MRIAVASSGLGHVARGVEAWASDLARALFHRGVRVTLYKGGGGANAPYERVIPCWQRGSERAWRLVRWLPRGLSWRLGLASGYGVEQATFAWGLIRRLRAERIDVLHVQDPQLALIVQRARALGLVRTRTILAHGTEEPASFLRRINFLQHLAPWHEEECRAAGAWREAWTTVPNFVDTERFCPGRADALRSELGIPPDALVVLTAAAIKRKHKRIDYLIAEVAAVRAARPDVPVWLVVAGGEEAETQEMIGLGRQMLGDRVRFLVRFPRERMADVYRSADVFVLASLKEMMPIALLEASASGLPCIVNDHPVLTWMTGPGGRPTSLAARGALAEALTDLLLDEKRRLDLGRRARRHCVEHFGQQAVVDRIMDSYRAVLGADRTPWAAVATEVRESRPAPVPSVSVVIPAHNAGRWIGETIQSVLAQTMPPSQIIVVDDGSTDDTPQRLAPYMDRICYVRQPNGGVAAARNTGIARAQGDLIAFLDADDVWHPRKLEWQTRAMAANPGIGLLGSAVYDWPAPATPQVQGAGTARIRRIEREALAVRNYLATSSVLARRDLVREIGPFDVALRGPEDHDYWLRAVERSAIGVLELPLTGYRSAPGSLSKRAASMEAGMLRILDSLDARGFWRGDRLLRRRAYGYVAYACSNLHGAAGDQALAVRRLLRSLVLYPLPLRRSEAGSPFVRARRMAVLLLRLLGIKRPETAG